MKEDLYTLRIYSCADMLTEMKHLTKEEVKVHKKNILEMIKGKFKKISVKVEVER